MEPSCKEDSKYPIFNKETCLCERLPRCKNGYYRDKKTNECIPKKSHSPTRKKSHSPTRKKSHSPKSSKKTKKIGRAHVLTPVTQ